MLVNTDADFSDDPDLRAVMTKLKNSEVISERMKKLYGISSFDTEDK